MSSLATQILRVPENIFYQAINQFQPEWVGAASTGVSAVLAPRVSPYFRGNLNLNQIFMSVINASWLLWDFAKLSEALQKKQISGRGQVGLLITALAGGAFLDFAGNRLYKKTHPLVLEEELPGVTVSYASQDLQSCSQALILTRTIVNMAITCFSPQRGLLAKFNVLGLGYSYLKHAQVKWFQISYKFDYPPVNVAELAPDRADFKALRFDYKFPLFPNQDPEQKCLICREDNPPFYFCSNAPSCLTCLTKNLYITCLAKTKKLDYVFNRDSIFHRNGRYLRTAYRVKVKFRESHFPSCCACNKIPDNHTLDLQYFDQDVGKGHFATTLEWAHDPNARSVRFPSMDSLWARLEAIYSVFHTALITMQQRHPDVVSKIALARERAVVFDLGVIAHHYWQLYKLFYEKYVVVGAQKAISRQQEQANTAESAYAAARQETGLLQSAINAAIEKQEILKVYRNTWIPLSELGRDIIADLQSATANGVVAGGVDGLTAKTLEGKEVLARLIQGLKGGDIIHTGRDHIPLSLEGILLLKRHALLLEKQQIQFLPNNRIKWTSKEGHNVVAAINQAIDSHQMAKLVDKLLPLSSRGAEVMLKYQQAWSDLKIKINQGQFQFSGDGEAIKQEFDAAVNNFDIVVIEEGNNLIPITPQGKELLKQSCRNMVSLQRACEADEQAKQALIAARDIHLRWQNEYNSALKSIMVMGGMVLVIISTLVAHFSRKKFYNIAHLMQVWRKVVLPGDYKNMQLNIGVIEPPHLAQCLIVHRLFLNIALVFFSPDKKTYALSALVQAATLWKDMFRDLIVVAGPNRQYFF